MSTIRRGAALREEKRAALLSNGWIDISIPLRTGMVHWPGDPDVRIERIQDMERGAPYNASLLSMGSHTGTHVDAPLHFLPGGAALDAMPLSASVGPARVIGIRDPEAIHAAELHRHRIRRGERILFKTRNSSRCWASDAFIQDFVHIARDAAEYLAQRHVRTVGVDYLSVGGFHKDGRETHVALLSAGIWVIEGLDLARVRPGRYELICLPLKIQGGDGGPARDRTQRSTLMPTYAKEFGVIGLGRMGGNLARQALSKDMRVVGLTLEGASADLLHAGLVEIRSSTDFRQHLAPPRAVFLYIPAGPAVDTLLDELASQLDRGDIIVDGGNSYWGDSIRRHRRLRERGVHLVDLGTSGGVEGALHGACFMAGGEREAVARLEPILLDLAVQGGYVHAGPPGSGHFVKLVHNGIEFGMLQAIAEGVDLLEHYREKLSIADVLHCWRFGSVIRSWLVDLMETAYRAEGGLREIPPFVEDTGEVNWLVNDALHMEVPVPVIAQSVMQLFASRDEQKDWARAIAMMRHGFGGHPYGPSAPIVHERRSGRVGDFCREA